MTEKHNNLLLFQPTGVAFRDAFYLRVTRRSDAGSTEDLSRSVGKDQPDQKFVTRQGIRFKSFTRVLRSVTRNVFNFLPSRSRETVRQARGAIALRFYP